MKIIIIIFIILIISIFVVNKHCKNKILKIILMILLSLISIYFVIFGIDLNRINTLKKPLFMIKTPNYCLDKCDSYLGLGYQVDIRYYENNLIESTEMFMFGKVIGGAIQDRGKVKSDINFNDKDISFNVKKEFITNTKANFTLKNNTNKTYIFGEACSLEYEENETWYKKNPINEMYFISIAYILQPNEKTDITIDWEYHYGKLSPGKYRIVKEVFQQLDRAIEKEDMIYIYSQFDIK